MRISTAHVSSVIFRSKSWKSENKNVKTEEPSDETQRECHGIEPNPSRLELCLREIILRFEMNLQNLLFS
jgi:hypothetical protein